MDKILETTLQEFSSLPHFFRLSYVFQKIKGNAFSFYVPVDTVRKDTHTKYFDNAQKVISPENIIFSSLLANNSPEVSKAHYGVNILPESLDVQTITPLLKELEVIVDGYDTFSPRYIEKTILFLGDEHPVYVPVQRFNSDYSPLDTNKLLVAPNGMYVHEQLAKYTAVPLQKRNEGLMFGPTGKVMTVKPVLFS